MDDITNKAPQGNEPNRSYKIHVGCGHIKLKGWINIDIDKNLHPDVLVDVTKGLPFHNDSVTHIFTEDLIEHLSLEDGKSFLNECFRVLQPSGFLRLVTPDLSIIMSAYIHREPRALQWYKDTFGCRTFAEMFNMAMRMAGHTFIYDRETLKLVLAEIGFFVEATDYRKSNVKEFRDIDLRGDGIHIYMDCQKKHVT